jgi:hypothetical protein
MTVIINSRLSYTHFIPHYRKESHMNRTDMHRLISVEADRIRACANRLIELYPPEPTDDHSLEEYIAVKDGGDRTVESLAASLSAIDRLFAIVKDHGDLLDK